jgi:hypothetical protein
MLVSVETVGLQHKLRMATPCLVGKIIQHGNFAGEGEQLELVILSRARSPPGYGLEKMFAGASSSSSSSRGEYREARFLFA